MDVKNKLNWCIFFDLLINLPYFLTQKLDKLPQIAGEKAGA